MGLGDTSSPLLTSLEHMDLTLWGQLWYHGSLKQGGWWEEAQGAGDRPFPSTWAWRPLPVVVLWKGISEGHCPPLVCPAPGVGCSGGVPRGALHLHGDSVGRAARGLPKLGAVPQGPLEDHPERFPQPL